MLHVIVAVLHLQYHFVEKHDSLYPAFFVKSRLVSREIGLKTRNALQTMFYFYFFTVSLMNRKGKKDRIEKTLPARPGSDIRYLSQK